MKRRCQTPRWNITLEVNLNCALVIFSPTVGGSLLTNSVATSAQHTPRRVTNPVLRLIC
jgi:hypothetical protein